MKFKSIFFLIFFFFFKIGIAHSISHTFSDDHVDECEQCILIVDSNKTQTFDDSSYTYNSNVVKEEYLKPSFLFYKNPLVVKENHRYYFFNKPPPSL